MADYNELRDHINLILDNDQDKISAMMCYIAKVPADIRRVAFARDSKTMTALVNDAVKIAGNSVVIYVRNIYDVADCRSILVDILKMNYSLSIKYNKIIVRDNKASTTMNFIIINGDDNLRYQLVGYSPSYFLFIE
jgi:hypothetical protein